METYVSLETSNKTEVFTRADGLTEKPREIMLRSNGVYASYTFIYGCCPRSCDPVSPQNIRREYLGTAISAIQTHIRHLWNQW